MWDDPFYRLGVPYRCSILCALFIFNATVVTPDRPLNFLVFFWWHQDWQFVGNVINISYAITDFSCYAFFVFFFWTFSRRFLVHFQISTIFISCRLWAFDLLALGVFGLIRLLTCAVFANLDFICFFSPALPLV